jgi:RNA-binding protein Nova
MASIALASELKTKRGRMSDFNEEVDRSNIRLKSEKPQCMIKFLVTNNIAGSLIGKAGSVINELQSQSKARISVSQSNVLYPGTLERVVVVSGSYTNVCHAQTLIWNKIAQLAAKEKDEAGEVVDDDETIIAGKLLIPINAAGLIIGRAGASIRMISEASGARIQLSTESRATQERIMIVSGTIDSCVAAVSSVIERLMEDEDAARYANPSPSYDRAISVGSFSVGIGSGGSRRSKGSRRVREDPAHVLGAETISASTTIMMSIPDHLVGCILGIKGATLAEIMRCTGTKVTVSPR